MNIAVFTQPKMGVSSVITEEHNSLYVFGKTKASNYLAMRSNVMPVGFSISTR